MRWWQRACAWAALLVLWLGASRARANEHSTPVTRSLPNGMKVAVFRDSKVPLAAIDIAFPVGSAMDPPEWPGLARLVGELFERAPTRHLGVDDADRLLEAAGLYASKPVVGVGRDRTHVTFQVPAQAVELGLWMAAERVGFLADGVDALALARAASALGKRLEKQADTTLSAMDDVIWRAVFGPAHPYATPSPSAQLASIPAEYVRDRIRRLYTPGNAAIAVAGNAPAGVESLVDKYFSVLAGRPAPKLLPVPAAPRARDVQLIANVLHSMVCLAWDTAPYVTPDDAALDVLARWLRVRLEERLVNREHLALGAGAGQSSSRLASIFTMCATLSDGVPAEKVVAAFDDELEQVRSQRVDGAAFSFAKQRMLVSTALIVDGVKAQAQMANSFLFVTGNANYLDEYLSFYDRADLAAVSAALKKNLTPEHRVVFHLTPNAAAPKSAAAVGEPPRSFRPPEPPEPSASTDSTLWYRPPGLSSAFHFSPDDAAERTLPDGTRILVSSRSTGPVVHARLLVQLTIKPPSLEAEWMLSTLIRTAPVQGEPLDIRLSKLGVSFETSWNWDVLKIDVDALPATLEPALAAILSALDASKLSDESFEQLKKNHLKGLLQATASHTLTDTLQRRLFPPAHRYTRDTGKAIDDMRSLERATLERYLRTTISKAPLVAAFVGNIDLDRAESALVAARAGRRSPFPRRRPPRAAAKLPKGAELEEDTKAEKTSLLFACPVAGWGESEYSTALALRWVFTGAFAPKIDDRFTAEKVHADRATSNVAYYNEAPYFFAEVSFPSSETAGAVRSVLDQLSALADQGPGAEGIAAAKRESLDYLMHQYDRLESQNDLLSLIAESGVDARAPALSYARMQAVTAADIRGLAKRCAASLRVVGVGRVREAGAELEKRGYGPVAYHSLEEKR